jgi:hypothetical protein
MAPDEPTSRPAAGFSEGELEETIREVIRANLRPDIAHAATVWLDERIAFYNLTKSSFSATRDG